MDINREKKAAITALLASAFSHYKKIVMAEPGQVVLPPNEKEVEHEYLNDPMIHRCVDATLYGIIEIFSIDNQQIHGTSQ